MSQVAELFRRLRTMQQILYFIGTTNFFKIHQELGFLNSGVESILIYWSGRDNYETFLEFEYLARNLKTITF